PEVAQIGARPANLIDSGMWDNPEGYDATWEGMTGRGDRRWASPGVVLDGKLVTTDLREIAEGVEESVEHSFFDSWSGGSHPYGKRTLPRRGARSWEGRYSWSTSARWRGRVVETGPGARLWATAMRGRMPYNPFISAEEGGVQLNLPEGALPQLLMDWKPPTVWNAIERNRARLYGIVFAALVAANEALNALDLQKQDDVEASMEMSKLKPRGEARGVGFSGDGLMGHWLTLDGGSIANYQVVSPATFNAGPGGPIEEAVNGTPLLQDAVPGTEALMAVRSFDPCGNCAST
ncbi:MAG: nickel-dependent hydrogenase large subunit, partial [Candidatus Dormibacteria bacterium]